MNRIEAKLCELNEKKEKAFITYITAGLPNYEKTKKLIEAQQKAGVDILELGIPFSDPIADGPVIQKAGYDAIQAGATLKKTFAMMKEVREQGNEMPIVFMLYYNTVLHYGISAFVSACQQCGVDGFIIPDLPLEEQEELQNALGDTDKTRLIQLVSPVSGVRIPKILEKAKGFVYCVSAMGVTGQEGTFHREIENYLKEVKAHATIPVMMGFGIREAKDIAFVKSYVDGAIVGSHLIQLLYENQFSETAAYEYCREFKENLKEL